jgi:magnesium transporter
MTRTRLYRSGVLESENFPVEDIPKHIAQPGVTVWLDLRAPDADDLATLSEKLDLHRLAVEDAGQERQRSKLDRYKSHLFVTAYAAALEATTGQLETFEVAAFVTPNVLITVRKSDQFDIGGVVACWDASPDLAKYGVSYLLHGLLDYVVDGYFAAAQILDDKIETLEDLLFEDSHVDLSVQRELFELRKSLVRLRRIVLPMREVVNSLMRRDQNALNEAMLPYYQDVYDHVLRATEWTESLRDIVTTVLETNLTIQSNRLNVITKKVTSWAAIIAVPTAITGFYGQNIPYPGSGHLSGFYISTTFIVITSIGLYVLFRRRDWI